MAAEAATGAIWEHVSTVHAAVGSIHCLLAGLGIASRFLSWVYLSDTTPEFYAHIVYTKRRNLYKMWLAVVAGYNNLVLFIFLTFLCTYTRIHLS